ncbi:aldo/keto reductase (plasmid) [Photobacterium sp. DA100]|uniref:aldo/keto reductase n=1 Tax=Photobacterium sp. DA100 TaxID=3027472 RepID=UPI00247AA64C|nr:aldo/keto reductase [Photobacterium sp. DA100]WEM45087.1 aldo/keto reductase [Photobacterium sp. DA100]
MNINDKAPFETYVADGQRYQEMQYRRCGNSGVQLPALSLGLWHNFGQVDSFANSRAVMRAAFDLGITHFDLANNYGPPYGSAEETFGRLIELDFKRYRDELFVSTKAGYDMWPGPYGNGGSRKYLISSLDQSLKRMNLDYVDVYYHHRPDPNTPIEETAMALDSLVRQGKALYIGLSNYNTEQTRQALEVFKQLGTPCTIQQSEYSMLNQTVEKGLLDLLGDKKVGMIAFSPLAQGALTNKYLNEKPVDSRANREHSYFDHQLLKEQLPKITALAKIAASRGQSLAQMSLAWLLNDIRVTSVLIGASSVQQLSENVASLQHSQFSEEELATIRAILATKE